ncbi:hypothetical protein BJX64DRAFT_293229 [Aspergillus heterothallicus]
MSARLSGRQSPPPEDQTGKQENSPPGSGRTDPKYAPPPDNPVHPLEEIEAAKYKKGPGN